MGHIQIFGKTKIEGKTVFPTPPLYDSTAAAYIAAVEAADGQALESSIKTAYNDFIVGCKSDGIWSALKASCILAGARTLSGALVPLVGSAPINYNFVSGDYSRQTGLKGDGSTKWLDSLRNNNADPQNDKHLAAWVTENPTSSANIFGIIGTSSTTGSSHLAHSSIAKNARLNQSTSSNVGGIDLGFFGASRSAASEFTARKGGSNTTYSVASATPQSRNLAVFAYRISATGAGHTNGRLSFYSIGESLDLALLDTRVDALMTAINAAI
jgi:hypothetical protein